jgi:signal transduction histidine kinase
MRRKTVSREQACAHELRSPLGRINLSVAIIEEALLGDLADRENLALKHLRLIQEETSQMEGLIASLLLSGKLDHESAGEFFPVDFSGLCSALSEQYAELMRRRGLDFEVIIQPGLWVRGDESILGMVPSNLLGNALKYTKAGGRVRFSLCPDQGSLCLKVENSHQPVPEEWLQKIFSPYYRGGIADDGGGAGFGLYLVEKIVALHGGRVLAQSSEFGLAFSVFLGLEQA